MKTADETEFRRSGREVAAGVAWSERWYGRVVLLSVSVTLLTLAFAPIKQFYLAWVGLVPWLVVIARCRSYKAAVLWGWFSGTMFFIANMWWMKYVTEAGMVGLMAILAAYWGVMGAIVRRAWNGGVRSFWLIPFGWTALEFIRGNFIWKGLPWLYLGHTQTPILPMCQIADVLGVYGVSFWAAMLNAIVAGWVLGGFRFESIRQQTSMAAVFTVLMLGYGVWRIKSTVTDPGPTILVVQSNYPQTNTGEKGATQDEMTAFHFNSTRDAMLRRPDVDLIVWSETVMPSLNFTARQVLRGTEYGAKIDATVKLLQNTAATFQAGLITGGRFEGDWKVVDGYFRPFDTRNSAYFFERSGLISELRYDKIHIVPFGEFLPFRQSLPWVFEMIVKLGLGPPDMDNYQLNAGDESNLTVFPLRKTRDPLDLDTWRIVTPICFEDIDSGLTARMFRPGADGQKRADVLVNLTNDGWFKANEMPQHLQVATFRSIENRVPTARAVNTGISGFVDSVGRTHDLIAAGTEGVSIAKVGIDRRITFYTCFGDVFGWICVSVTGSGLLLMFLNRKTQSAQP